MIQRTIILQWNFNSKLAPVTNATKSQAKASKILKHLYKLNIFYVIYE